jgi:hypothetical protein
MWDDTHFDILKEATRKPKGKRDVPKDCFGLPNECKINLFRVLLSCDEFGCIHYCQQHCIICA